MAAAEAALARLGARRRPSASRGRCTGSSRSTPTTRRCGPAILWNDQRTAAECAEIERADRARAADRADRQPRADRLHRAEAAVAAHARARRLRADPLTCCCRRTTCGCGSAASARSTSPTRPGRCSSTSRSGAGATRCCAALELPGEWLPPVSRVAGRPGRRRRRPGGGRARRRRRPRPGRLSVVLGTSGVVFAALPRFAADPEARVHAFCHAVPGDLARDGRDALGGGLAALAARRGRARHRRSTTLVAEAEALGAGRRGPASSRRTSRASARRTPTRTRAARSSASSLRHDRGALVRAVLEGVAYGLRDSLELLARARRRARRRPRLRRRRAQRAVAADRRVGARAAARATAVDEGAAFGAALLAGCASGAFAEPQEAVERCVRVHGQTNPDPAWAAAYASGYARFRELYPLLAPLAEHSRV